MSVMVLDAGNSIIKAKIARWQDGEISFPHAIQKLTEAEYRRIITQAGIQNRSEDYLRINGEAYAIGESAERHGFVSRRTGAARYTRDYYGVLATPALSRLYDRGREIVMDIERKLGFEPTDHEYGKLGYDIESRIPGTGRLRFIEVKGRISGAPTITITKNEILYSLNKPDDFIHALVEFLDGEEHRVHYLRQPFRREPDFGVTSINYDFAELLRRAEAPSWVIWPSVKTRFYSNLS